MARMNWARARFDRIISERGSEPVSHELGHQPDPPARRTVGSAKTKRGSSRKRPPASTAGSGVLKSLRPHVLAARAAIDRVAATSAEPSRLELAALASGLESEYRRAAKKVESSTNVDMQLRVAVPYLYQRLVSEVASQSASFNRIKAIQTRFEEVSGIGVASAPAKSAATNPPTRVGVTAVHVRVEGHDPTGRRIVPSPGNGHGHSASHRYKSYRKRMEGAGKEPIGFSDWIEAQDEA